MSPTISAASKITPSPRKRILEERNEMERASVSFPELKIPSFGESVNGSESEYKKEGGEEEAPVSSKGVPVVNAKAELPPNSEAEPELINLDPSFKISPRSAPVIAPLDSDPSAPPYDPKTNYLSPRPRFLHYKPNPRVELYLDKGREGGKRLDDIFSFGSFSDTDATEEEMTQSDDSPKELEDDVSSSEEAKAEAKEQEQEEDELIVSESNPNTELLSPKEETVEAKNAPKRRSVWRSNLKALLIVLSIACVSFSVANLPVVDHSVFDSSANFFKDYDHSEMLAFGKARLDGLAQKLGIWYENSVTFLYDLVSYLRGPDVESLHYYNLTDLFEDVRIDGYDVSVFVMPIRSLEIDVGDEYEEKQLGQEAETSFDVGEETPDQQITSPVSELVFGVPKAELVEPESGLSGDDFEPHSAPILEEVSEALKTELVEPENSPSGGDFEADRAMVTQADEVQLQSEVSQVDMSSSGAEIEPAKVEDFGSEPPTYDAPSEEDAKASEDVDFAADGTEDNSSKVKVLGMALLVVLAAIGSAAFVATKNSNNGPTLNAKSSVVAKKSNISPEKSNLEVKQHSSWNYSGDYCPSEMSSYDNNTSYYNQKGLTKKGLNEEAQSYERSQKKKGQRRESMASSMDSSMGSPSYGSFTTYEKIPTKNVSEQTIIHPKIMNNIQYSIF